MARIQHYSATSQQQPTPRGSERSGVLLRVNQFIGREVAGAYCITDFREYRSRYPVYDAEHQRLKRHADVWLLDDYASQEEALRSEVAERAALYAKISHPNLTRLLDYDFSSEEGGALVFEPSAGLSLEQHVQSQGPLPYKTWLGLASQLLSATATLHAAGYFLGSLSLCDITVRTMNEKLFLQLIDPQIASLLANEQRQQAKQNSSVRISSAAFQGFELSSRGDLFVIAQTLLFLLTGTESSEQTETVKTDCEGKDLVKLFSVLHRGAKPPSSQGYTMDDFSAELQSACEGTNESIPKAALRHPATVATTPAAAYKKTPLRHTSYRVSSRPSESGKKNVVHQEILEHFPPRTSVSSIPPSSAVQPTGKSSSNTARQKEQTLREGKVFRSAKAQIAEHQDPSAMKLEVKPAWLESLEHELSFAHNELRFASLELEPGRNHKQGYRLLKSAVEQSQKMQAVFDVWSPNDGKQPVDELPASSRAFKVSLEVVEQEVSRLALGFVERELGSLNTQVVASWDSSKTIDLSFLSAEDVFLLARAKQKKSLKELVQSASGSRLLALLSLIQLWLHGYLALA